MNMNFDNGPDDIEKDKRENAGPGAGNGNNDSMKNGENMANGGNMDNEKTQNGVSEELKEEDERNKVVVYQLNDETAEFEELELDEDVKLYELLDPSFILLFLDPKRYKAWIWQGSETSTRMKFISAKLASAVRDQYGVAMKIITVDDGNEPTAFKVMVGLEEEVDYTEEQTGPTYTGTESDLKLLDLANRDKILLILEKAGVPDGYKRELVIVKNRIYKYVVREIEYMGKWIEEKLLLELDENVPDGPYLAQDYIPRILFSFNNVVLVELLKKMTEEEYKKFKEKEQRMLEEMQKEKTPEPEIDTGSSS
ncbi:MAG: hypothetical protein ACTSU2_14805 [Promethearchaeota archaeon]